MPKQFSFISIFCDNFGSDGTPSDQKAILLEKNAGIPIVTTLAIAVGEHWTAAHVEALIWVGWCFAKKFVCVFVLHDLIKTD